jgi:hypothetical protein
MKIFADFHQHTGRQSICLAPDPPRYITELIREKGPEILNIQHLDSALVVQYLTGFSQSIASQQSGGRLGTPLVDKLSRIWEWIDDCPFKRDVIHDIGHLLLIPTYLGLQCLSKRTFSAQQHHPADTMILRKLGLHFLEPDISNKARRVISPSSINNLGLVLDSISSPSTWNLTQNEQHDVLKYISRYCSAGALNDTHLNILRNMPIFPILSNDVQSGSVGLIQQIGSLTTISVCYSVTASAELPAVPAIPQHAFLNVPRTEAAVLSHLPFTVLDIGTDDVISLALDHFATQTPLVQDAFVRHISTQRRRIRSELIKKLNSAKFLLLDPSIGTQAPAEIIDPESSLFDLYPDRQIILALFRTRHECMGHLRSLQLLCYDLSPEIIQERIAFVAGDANTFSARHAVAVRLLQLMSFSTSLDWRNVRLPPVAWLPTTTNVEIFETPSGCLPECVYRPELFDLVLPSLDRGIAITAPLKSLLGWDKHLPFDVISTQLKRVLTTDGKKFKKLKVIVKELGRRSLKLSDTDVMNLKGIVEGKPWIPLENLVLETARVVLDRTRLPGFYFIAEDKAELKVFLGRMGCLNA